MTKYEELPTEQSRALDRNIELVAAILTAAYWSAKPGVRDTDVVLQTWIDFRDEVGNVILSEL